MAINLHYTDITHLMKKGGSFRYFHASTQATSPTRIQDLWHQIQAQREPTQTHTHHCCFLLKSPANHDVTMDEITDLCDLIQEEYSGDIIWGYHSTNDDELGLEVIG